MFLIYPLGRLTLNVISLLTGFFLATVLATLPSQTGDWGVVAGLVAIFELISRIVYIPIVKRHNNSVHLFFTSFSVLNSVKIGIIYGLFVDAFKLGS
uniref:hypothetical protein n=1 Tax=Pseudoerythrocladia kornmannii TaxID=753682 RepID=UPI001FCE11A4|nr:hypothetical protein MW575_pgp007 [Pseudoerythrocladia kornmannii]UNJ16853.1 hypothetical protein [Pseudoerythrocladia kornmannii]